MTVMEPSAADDPLAAATRDIIAELNDTHGLALTLQSRFDSGMQNGAWLVVDDHGLPAVLKWTRDGTASGVLRLAGVVERIRGTGYPTPAWLAVGRAASGCTFHLQGFAIGRPSWPLTVAATESLIKVLERQAGLDPDPSRDRSAQVSRAAVDESVGGLRHSVRQSAPGGDALVDRYDVLLDSYGVVDLPGGDLVHGDFNTCNVLLHDDAVTAVIDIEELGSGTRAIDYGCLLREAYVQGYEPEVKKRLRRAGEAVAGPGALAVCATAAAFFIVGFKLRHEPAVVMATMRALHQMADDLTDPRSDQG